MLISEVNKVTGLTKKAIEYYCEQGLVMPTIMENGYRDFSENDISQLEKIYVLRKLDISIVDIKSVLADKTGSVLQKLSLQKGIKLKCEKMKKVAIDKLSRGNAYSDISDELQAIEASETISEKLLEIFPGYYGRYICLHFARFLNDPISTNIQRVAYEQIVSFLDSVSKLEFPLDLQKYLDDYTLSFGNEQVVSMIESTNKSVENPSKFMLDNKEMLEQYIEYKKSKEYLDSSAYKIQLLMKEFNSTSGYYDFFLPAMKELSPSYAEYYKQLEIAYKKLQEEYPDIATWNNK